MVEPVEGGRATLHVIAITAIALAGFLVSLTPAAVWTDNRLLDVEWRILREAGPRFAPDDVIIVGIDSASANAIPAPPELWHEPLGRALARIAAAKPRAIGLDYPLPERSYDSIHPGLDRVLFVGMAAAVENGPFVVALNIDSRTRTARNIHTPFLALLGDSRLGIGLTARDSDGVTRRFSLLIPTEDGGFPTLAGRLCRALTNHCSDGLIDYSLGMPFRYVSLYDVLTLSDPALMSQLFRNRIVLIGETQPYMDRIAVPLNMAAWEGPGRDSPGVVVHAQTLRTAIGGNAPQEAIRPVTVILVLVAALPFLVRRWPWALAASALGIVAACAGALVSLHLGLFVPISAVLLTLVLAGLGRMFLALRTTPAVPSNIQHSG
ncbi:MAG TPA: CHASE2 domain-containing protein [Usitatibacter sp.]|nr:CHASE2 domain-containing protein [Usitatibacter sp.]